MKASAGNKGCVLIIVENLPSPFDRRVWQEATTLKSAGYDVVIVCPTGEGYRARYETLDGIEIHRYALPFEASSPVGYAVEYVIAFAMQLYLACKIRLRRRVDVVHACNPPDTIFLIGALLKLFGARFLFDHHDANPELYLAKFGKKDWRYGLITMLERWTFKTADASIATNESYRKIAITRGRMPEERVTVVRSGPALDRLKIVPLDPRHKHGKPYLIGYVGVMGKQEGLDYLLRAAKHLVHDLGRRDVHFCLVGSGTELSRLKAYARELDVTDCVTFTGRVPDEELVSVLCTADVCVNPDVANEMNDISTMNKVMEYMALGKPIVQFDLVEGRVSAREASLYAKRNDWVDFARKIAYLLEHPQERAAMGLLGRERVHEQLAWRHEAPKLLRAYDELLHRRPQRASGRTVSSLKPSGRRLE